MNWVFWASRGTEDVAFINTDHPFGPYGRNGPDGPASRSSLLALAGFIGLPLLVGAVDGAVSSSGVQAWYLALTPPPGTPPSWAFGPVWTLLYFLIGTAAWLVWRRQTLRWLPPAGSAHLRPLRLWGWQLLANAAWNPAFFGLRSPKLALAVVVVLLALIVVTTRAFWRVRPLAGILMLPYFGWTCYAAYLTAGFCWLNPAV